MIGDIYRNPKLLALAKEAPHCFFCGEINFGQVVGAHANMQEMGKGTGIKAADVIAFMCNTCHDTYDGRTPTKMNREDRSLMWYRAAVRSIRWALEYHPEVFCGRNV